MEEQYCKYIQKMDIKLFFIIVMLMIPALLHSNDITKYDDLFTLHFTMELPIYKNKDENSPIISWLKAPEFIQILEKHDIGNRQAWFRIKLSDETIGWAKLYNGYPMMPLDSNEIIERKEKFNLLKKDVSEFSVPNNPGKITYQIIADRTFTPFSNRYGKFWEFRDNNTFYIYDTSSGGIGEIGVWTINNGYLVTKIYGTAGYGPGSPLYDEIFYWNFEKNDESIYSKSKLINSNGYEIFLDQNNQDIGTFINIDGYSSKVLYELRILHNDVSVLSDPTDTTSKIEYYDGNSRSQSNILQRWSPIFVIAETTINNEKWFYIDSNTDDWLSSENYFFGWIKSENAPKIFGILNDSYVRIRERPNIESDQLGYLHKGQHIEIINRTDRKYKVENMNDYWYEIKTDEGIIGWSFGYFIDIEE